MVVEMAGQRLFQDLGLVAQGAAGQPCQRPGAALPGDQGLDHCPARDPEQVADHDGELDLGIFEDLFQPLLLTSALADQGAPVAGQVTQLADRLGVDEAGRAHAPLGDFGQPDAVELVGLGPARDVLDVAGVQQPALEALGFQQVKRRLPVGGSGLHHHQRHALAAQAISQPQQRAGGRGVLAHFLAAPPRLVLVRHPDAGRQRGLADIQCRHPLDQLR
jgi:hypothetical protein